MWFLPTHTRGRITMTPSGEVATHSCCVPEASAEVVAVDHCGNPISNSRPVPDDAPSEEDKANCAVCFWAAGILPEAAVVFEVRPIDRALIETREAIAQCSTWFVPTNAFPRGPPALLA